MPARRASPEQHLKADETGNGGKSDAFFNEA